MPEKGLFAAMYLVDWHVIADLSTECEHQFVNFGIHGSDFRLSLHEFCACLGNINNPFQNNLKTDLRHLEPKILQKRFSNKHTESYTIVTTLIWVRH